MTKNPISKKTVGQTSTELLSKTPDTLSPIDIQKAAELEIIRNLEWAVKHELKSVPCTDICRENCLSRKASDGDFYVSILTKKERKLENVLRNYFVVTKDCPTPFFDQSVWKYNYKLGDLVYLWTVPNQETALILKKNRSIVHPEEHWSLKFVLDYYNGDLHRLAKKLNGETMNPGGALIV